MKMEMERHNGDETIGIMRVVRTFNISSSADSK